MCFLASVAGRWWLSLLLQSPGIEVVYVWAKKREAAEALHRSLEGLNVPGCMVVWGEGGSSHNRKTLRSIAHSQNIGSFIIAASPESHVRRASNKACLGVHDSRCHGFSTKKPFLLLAYVSLKVFFAVCKCGLAKKPIERKSFYFYVLKVVRFQADIIETILSVAEGRTKHIFSCTPPTFNVRRMKRLLDLQQQKPHGLWTVCSSFTHEVAAVKAKAILLDLGQLVAAQIICTSLLQNQAVAECGNAASLLKHTNSSGILLSLLGF